MSLPNWTSFARLIRSEEIVYAAEEILPLILTSVGSRPRLNAAAPAGYAVKEI